MKRHRAASILYVTYDGLLEPLGASQVLPYVRRLRGLGFSIAILSFEKTADLGRVEALHDVREELGALGVPWVSRPYHKRPSLPATGWDVLSGRRVVRAWARAHQRAGTRGLVHARGYLPGLMGLGGAGAGARLLFDMRGFWVDERIEGGYWAEGSVPVRLGRWVERALLHRADHLVLLARRGAARLPELAGGHEPPPWTVVPTCVDLTRFPVPDAAQVAEARRALGVGGDPVLVHIGTLTGWYDGEATMAVARAFVARTGGTFAVLTRDVDAARSLAAGAGVEAQVRSVPPEDVPRWLQAADAGLTLVRASPAKNASLPTKLGEYLATGLAVLGTPVGDMDELEDGKVLRLFRPGGSVDEAAAWLATAARAPVRAKSARAIAEAHLDLEDGVRKLAGVYTALGVQPGGSP